MKLVTGLSQTLAKTQQRVKRAKKQEANDTPQAHKIGKDTPRKAKGKWVKWTDAELQRVRDMRLNWGLE